MKSKESTLLFGVVTGPKLEIAEEEILSHLDWIDAVEFRLDLFIDLDLRQLRSLLKKLPIPILFTLRRQDQGGGFTRSEKIRLQFIEELCQLQPDFLDLEYDVPTSFRKKLFFNYPKIHFIASYHNFEKFPKLDPVLSSLFTPYAHFYKIAIHCSSCIEALQLLLLSKKHTNLATIGLGERAQFTRLIAPILGMPLSYVALKLQTAAGQLTLKDLQLYRFSTLNSTTVIYALLGDPIDISLSPVVHNTAFAAQKKNALYCKIPCDKNELTECLSLIQQLPFKGLSITMPLKEITAAITHSLQKAVNTLVIDSEITSFNTDGIGAVQALEKKTALFKKKIVLFGAGGVAQAIAQKAIDKGAFITFINRTREKAIQLAKIYRCRGGGIDLFPLHYDIIINCTPNPDCIQSEWICSNSIAMDTVYQPHWTGFLKKASLKNCKLIFGKELFVNQAVQQQKLWDSSFSKEELEQVITQAIHKSFI
ncbi:Shikimate dehydrogenase (NADP(+)) [Candidatus Rhabdochlamydia oedothoracis]|uniref:shikimate dehydrogenase (NADP(+)) n=1 Tax=Candidatus Rhabdochlamydia oedothoracis TaxID=2720720 RepID=A0ABX8V0S9_9BACT|nr:MULTISPECIES: type I 3-dehydroquinate dehydratase [Rhabdochlamydia]KAG6558979.1 Shikimate dehydrogenase (NADP(+)) [Candidatus Rhabdochlamydia sp. W815]QYF48771.1 Shikimate dehydrogenase (NADP(+)) [Candidatus Rhabdochlamydia oedothoracis]